MKVRRYTPQPHLSRYENIKLAIGKMEDDKILYERLNYKESTIHVLMHEDGLTVDVCIEGMKREDIAEYLVDRAKRELARELNYDVI